MDTSSSADNPRSDTRAAKTLSVLAVLCLFPGFLFTIPVFFSAVFALLAIRKWKSIDPKSKHIQTLKGLTIVALCFSCVFLSAFVAIVTDSPKDTSGTQEQTRFDQQAELEGKVRKHAKRALSHSDVAEVSLWHQSSGADAGGYWLIVIADAESDLFNSWLRQGILEDFRDMAKRISRDDSLNDVRRYTLKVRLPLVDSYGNSSNGIVAQLVLSSETAHRINWDHMELLENFERLLSSQGEIWWHPAITK